MALLAVTLSLLLFLFSRRWPQTDTPWTSSQALSLPTLASHNALQPSHSIHATFTSICGVHEASDSPDVTWGSITVPVMLRNGFAGSFWCGLMVFMIPRSQARLIKYKFWSHYGWNLPNKYSFELTADKSHQFPFCPCTSDLCFHCLLLLHSMSVFDVFHSSAQVLGFPTHSSVNMTSHWQTEIDDVVWVFYFHFLYLSHGKQTDMLLSYTSFGWGHFG